jgi:Maltokinase N-terminal cap domain
MATIHQATLSPTKLELLTAWLPGRHWYPADDVKDLQRVGACRLDDPEGEVGVEMFVVRSEDGPVVHVPLTYRAAPLAGADFHLVGTTEHSVLGTRYVYDAVIDPVYVEAMTAVIRTGGQEAEEFVETDEGPRRRDPLMRVRGSGWGDKWRPAGRLVRVEEGDPAVAVAEGVRLEVRRVLTEEPATGPLYLTASWDENSPRTVLAELD